MTTEETRIRKKGNRKMREERQCQNKGQGIREMGME
jgi:hypothetical protein